MVLLMAKIEARIRVIMEKLKVMKVVSEWDDYVVLMHMPWIRSHQLEPLGID